jgi:hypothetical protein
VTDWVCRFVVAGTPTTLGTFERALFGPFTIIIQQEIEREFRGYGRWVVP